MQEIFLHINLKYSRTRDRSANRKNYCFRDIFKHIWNYAYFVVLIIYTKYEETAEMNQ